MALQPSGFQSFTVRGTVLCVKFLRVNCSVTTCSGFCARQQASRVKPIRCSGAEEKGRGHVYAASLGQRGILWNCRNSRKRLMHPQDKERGRSLGGAQASWEGRDDPWAVEDDGHEANTGRTWADTDTGHVASIDKSDSDDSTDSADMSRARKRRLEKSQQRRAERKAEEDRVFQAFAKDVATHHPEMMDLLEGGDATPDNAEELAAKVEERLKAKMGEWMEERTGSSATMDVTVKFVDPFDLNLWLRLQKKPTEEDLHSLSSVFRAWYLIGKIGGYNQGNLQFMGDDEGKLLSGEPPGYKNREVNDDLLPALMHNIGDLEIQGDIVRVWVDMGTADMLALDVLVNALVSFSSEHLGIKSLTIGGDSVPGWKEVASGQYQTVEI